MTMNHISLSDLTAYVSERLDDGIYFQIELHLSECDECAEKVFHYNTIRGHFNAIWHTLSIEHLSSDIIFIQLLESLSNSTIQEKLLPRVEKWLRNFSLKTHLIIGFAVDSTKKTAEIIKDSLLPQVLFGQIPRFELVGAPVRIRGDGDPDAERHQKMRGPSGEEIEIYQTRKALKIIIKNSKLDPPLPLIWALSLEKATSNFKETYHPEETDYLVAEFSINELANLSKYVLLLETR